MPLEITSLPTWGTCLRLWEPSILLEWKGPEPGSWEGRRVRSVCGVSRAGSPNPCFNLCGFCDFAWGLAVCATVADKPSLPVAARTTVISSSSKHAGSGSAWSTNRLTHFSESERDVSRPKEASVAVAESFEDNCPVCRISEKYARGGRERGERKGRREETPHLIYLHKNLARQDLLYPFYRLGTNLRDIKLPAKVISSKK